MSTNMSRRCKAVRFPDQLVVNSMRKGDVWPPLRVDSGLPSDARLVDAWRDDPIEATFLLVESSEWDEVPEGEPWPEAVVRFTRLDVSPVAVKAS